ncbi:dTTP/UTP pyrophosphatase-like [Ciona intestinalis]
MLSPLRELLRNLKVVLASSSPQRRKLLEQIELVFDVCASPFDEEAIDKTAFKNPKDYVKLLAHGKALEVANQHKESTEKVLIIGADTVIIFENQIIGKPHTAQVSVETLNKLSGKSHTVCTGVSVILVEDGGFSETVFHETTQVEFGKLSKEIVQSYVDTGEPLNKAGAYGIQGQGAMFVQRIEGCYNNVVGLPVYKLCNELTKFLDNKTKEYNTH